MGRARDQKNKRAFATIGEAQRRKRLLAEAREEAKEFSESLRTDQDPADAVQQILDNLMASYQYATQEVFCLQEDEYWLETLSGKVVNHWIREQERLALQVVHVAGKAASMGLAERKVKVQEAQAALFASVVEAVLVGAGIDGETRRTIHEGIATRLEGDIDGVAHEVAPRSLLPAA